MRGLGARLLSAVGLQDCRRALGPGVNCDVGAEVVLVLADDLAQRDLGNLVNGGVDVLDRAPDGIRR